MSLTLFLGGDVMTGRGVDQIMRCQSEPGLKEPFVTDAREYVRLAEDASGPVPRGVEPAYIWGDALTELERTAPQVRIVNLETSITRSAAYWPGKGIHYRMHPGNVSCLTAAGIDVCVLANNHVLDFGRPGLVETLETLEHAGIRAPGAGRTVAEARRPAAFTLPGGARLLIAACGHESSGIPSDWAALEGDAGVDRLPDLRDETADEVAGRIAAGRHPGDIAVASIHWGDNWGYDVPSTHVRFAHRLVDDGVDIVYGHSSHHPRPIEIYRHKLILYGCGDLMDDYEGIAGYEQYRDDLVLMFFPSLDSSTGRLATLRMTPMRIRRMRLERVTAEPARWLCDTLSGASGPFGVRVSLAADNDLTVAE